MNSGNCYNYSKLSLFLLNETTTKKLELNFVMFAIKLTLKHNNINKPKTHLLQTDDKSIYEKYKTAKTNGTHLSDLERCFCEAKINVRRWATQIAAKLYEQETKKDFASENASP